MKYYSGDKIEKNEMGGAYSTYGRGDLGDSDVDGRIILRWIFSKWDVGGWIGLMWIMIKTVRSRFYMRY
jgi:hypothetical protein